MFVGSPGDEGITTLSDAAQSLIIDDGVEVFAVGVGSKFNRTQLRDVASSPDHVFVLGNVGRLNPAVVEAAKRRPEGPFVGKLAHRKT